MGDRAASWLLALLALFLLLPVARAQPEQAAGEALLLADSLELDSKTNVLTAMGNVEVIQGGRHLWADRLRYDQNADRIDAEGNVTLLEPTGEALYAEQLTLSDDLKNGVAQQLRARLTDNSLFAAASGRRTGGTVTELDHAVYSPCPFCQNSTSPPLWQIEAQRVVHDQVGAPDHLSQRLLRPVRGADRLHALSLDARPVGRAQVRLSGPDLRQRQRTRPASPDAVLFRARAQLRSDVLADLR